MSIFNSLSNILPFFGAVLGMGIGYKMPSKSPNGLKLILSFSGAFLLGITIFHLMPEVFFKVNSKPGLWIVCGIILQILLEYLSQGTEHGHSHIKSNEFLPWLLFISLCLHAFIEGLPLGHESSLVWGIFIHKIPIGMVLFYMIWNTKNSKVLKITALFIFAIMSSLGSITLEYSDTFQNYQTQITAIVLGMLLHIATTILFESNQGHAFNIRKLLSILLAFIISYFI
jgi:zinc transporter ZupT